MIEAMKEMDTDKFLALVDTLMENLERQAGEDPVGVRAVSEVKDEIRRRIQQAKSAMNELVSTPITVSVLGLSLSEVVSTSTLGVTAKCFQGTPYLVRVVDRAGNVGKAVSVGFFSATEVEAFFQGLRTAGDFGLLFTGIPNHFG